MIEILILAVLAVIVGGALYTSLGNKRFDAEEQERPRNTFGFFTPLDQKPSVQPEPVVDTTATPIDFDVDTPLGKVFSQIRQTNTNFTVGEFLNGAKAAFTMISTAYVSGDKQTLELLCHPDIAKRILAAVQQRQKDRITLVKDVVSILDASVEDAEIDKNNQAQLTVAFKSRQILAQLDKEQNVLEGDTDTATEFDDRWVFARSLSDNEPGWKLIAV